MSDQPYEHGASRLPHTINPRIERDRVRIVSVECVAQAELKIKIREEPPGGDGEVRQVNRGHISSPQGSPGTVVLHWCWHQTCGPAVRRSALWPRGPGSFRT